MSLTSDGFFCCCCCCCCGMPCQVHLAEVSSQAHSTLAAIRAHKPWTISWSNVPDYYDPQVGWALSMAW